MKLNRIYQILENMKTAYSLHAQQTGKMLPEGWDTTGLQEHTPARATAPVDEEDPDYNPEPIDNLDPLIIGIKTLESTWTNLTKNWKN